MQPKRVGMNKRPMQGTAWSQVLVDSQFPDMCGNTDRVLKVLILVTVTVLCLYISLTDRVQGPYCKLLTKFFQLQFMAQARCAWAINRRGINEDP